MITLIEALNYRCLRYVSRPLEPFHVLVGPNASGKTTFLDVVAFLQDLVTDGFDGALSRRTANPVELLFRRQGAKLELAIEARIPNDLRLKTAKPDLDTARYEVAIGFDESQRQFEFKAEKFLLKQTRTKEPLQRSLFPMSPNPPASLLTGNRRNTKTVVNKVPGGNDNFYSETYRQGGKGGRRRLSSDRKSRRSEIFQRTQSPFRWPPGFENTLAPVYSSLSLTASRSDNPVLQSELKGFCPTDPICPGWLAVCAKRTQKGIVTGSHTFGRRLPTLRTSLPLNARRTDIATWSTFTEAG